MTMIEMIGAPAVYEQLAEECAELSKACLKMSRIMRGENPPATTEVEAMAMIREEFTDVMHCALELGLKVNLEQMVQKDARWKGRVRKGDRHCDGSC